MVKNNYSITIFLLIFLSPAFKFAKYIPLANILSNTREGINGIGGLQTRGQLRTGMPGM